jgi:dihydroneopterin aldolase
MSAIIARCRHSIKTSGSLILSSFTTGQMTGQPSVLMRSMQYSTYLFPAPVHCRGKNHVFAQRQHEARCMSSHFSSCSLAVPSIAHSDKIVLSNLSFYGYHGYYQAEKTLGQKFIIDAVLFTCLRRAGESDDLLHTTNYAISYEVIRPRQISCEI